MRATPLAPRLSAARRPALASLPGLLALASVACSSAPAATQAPKPGALPGDTSAPGAPSPARYLVTRYFGALFDQGSDGAAVPRPEFAILQGRRVKLDGGAILATVRSPAGLLGFRSLPAHLGGGYLLWSDVRTFHAKDFLGELTPVAELGPAAGTTPWFSSVLLHTDRGIFELDLKTRAVTPWRLHPGVVGARALDDKRGVTIDLFGRARVTTDGGQKWTDLVAAHGYLTSALRTGRKGEIELVSLTGSADFRLVPGGSAVEPGLPPPPPYNRRYYGYSSYPYQYINQPPPPESDHVYPISQTQAHEALAGAVSGGLLLSGDRVLVGREGGLLVLSTKTGAEINDVPLLHVDARYAACQPVRSGSTLLLACSHEEGAHVLVVDGPLSAPRLEATFPRGAGSSAGAFISDDRGHLAFTGRCGRTPPSPDDFGARVVQRQPYEEEDPYGSGYGPYGGYGGYDPEYSEYPEEPADPEKPLADDKRICVRLDGGDWIEHRLTGDDARDLYRWVLGDDGHVTALLLEGANPEEEDPDKGSEGDEGDKPIDLDDDETLRRRGGARTPAPRSSLLAVPPPPPPPGTAMAGSPTPPPAPTTAAKAGKAPPPPPTAGPRAGKPPPPKPAASAKPVASAKPAASAKPIASAKPKASPPKESLRRVRLDPKDRLLKKAKWAPVRPPLTQAPWRSIDPNFWLEPDGSIRGWVRLHDDTGSGDSHDPSMSEEGEKPSPIALEVGGRFTGVRITPQGKTTLLQLPRDTQHVVFGGRYAMARAEDEDGDRTSHFETTDGGATWVEVEGPPIGDMDEPYDDSRWPGCSSLGCVLATGLVRVGWGSPKPAPPKKDTDVAGPDTDPFPMPRLPRLRCTIDGDLETFPRSPPKPKSAPPTPPKPAAPKVPGPPGLDEEFLSQLPPDLQELLRSRGGAAPPGLAPTSSPVAPGARPKGAKPPAPPKPPPPPPAPIVSIRTLPSSPLGQPKDKTWVADFVVPFEPASPAPKHVSVAANGLEKLTGSVVPVLGDRGVDLLLTWDKKRTLLGSSSPVIGPFEHSGRVQSAVAIAPGPAAGKPAPGGKPASGASIVALDEDRRVVVLLAPDASRPILRYAKHPDPTRGRLVVARRVDAPGAGLVWYSAYSGDVFAGAIDLGRAEVGPLVRLASIGTLTDGGLPACAASAKPSGPTYDFVADIPLAVTVSTRSDKALLTESNVSTSMMVRASEGRLCVLGVEVGGSRAFEITATFGPKGAAVSRSRASAEDPTKLSIDKLSCILKENESR